MGRRPSQKSSSESTEPDVTDEMSDPISKADKQVARLERKNKKKQHYVDATKFYNDIKNYYETDELPDCLSDSINKIAIGLSYATNFINYTYKDEMVGDAIYKMFVALKNKKFDVTTKNNPFSYFTTIAFHAFINRIKKEKKYRDTISKYQESIFTEKLLEDGSFSNAYIATRNNSDDGDNQSDE